MIRVTVAREHVNAQIMNLTDIHGSAKRKGKLEELYTNVKFFIKLALQNLNLLSIYSFNNLAGNLLLI